jgi:hypothetical protein
VTVRRFDRPPDRIDALVGDLGRARAWTPAPLRFVVGRIVPHAPPGSDPVALPYGLDEALADDERAAPAAALRADLEEPFLAFTRPILERVERGRDFYVSDGSGRALVRIADDAGRLHPDVELHLHAPFRAVPAAPATETGGELVRTAYVRALRFGDAVAVVGHLGRAPDPLGAAYRDEPELPALSAELGPVHLYDGLALRQLIAAAADPWYRRLLRWRSRV